MFVASRWAYLSCCAQQLTLDSAEPESDSYVNVRTCYRNSVFAAGHRWLIQARRLVLAPVCSKAAVRGVTEASVGQSD